MTACVTNLLGAVVQPLEERERFTAYALRRSPTPLGS